MRKLIVTLLALLLVTVQGIAQNRTITGKVTDKTNGTPLPGVSVTVKDGTIGTQTGADGTYSLNVPASAKTLVFSFVGFADEEVGIAGKSTIDMGLTNADKAMQEVVVVGYGTQRKRAVTSAIGKVDPAPIASLVTPSIDKQLGGRTAGLQVTNSSGLVNQVPRIRVRGINSISGARDPLIVIDGVPMVDGNYSGTTNSNALADINPADVESIEVLKDGSATAIFGSRASNGVLMITTKKGRSGRSNVNYAATFGFSNPANRFDLLNAEEFVTIANEKSTAAGQANQAFMNAERTNTDWQDYVINENAFSQIHTLSMDGGNDRSTFYFSANYANQEGMIITNKVQRYGIRANIDHKVNKWLKIGNNITLSRTKDNDQNNGTNALSGAIANAIRSLPNVRIFDPSNTKFSGYNVTPLGDALGQDANLRAIENNYTNIAYVLNKNRYSSTKHRILNNAYLELKPIRSLTLTSKFGIDYYTGSDFQSWDPLHGDGRGSVGYVYNGGWNNFRWVWQNYGNFLKSFGNHNFTLTGGLEYQNEEYNGVSGSGTGISDIFFQQQNIISGSYSTQFSGGSYVEGPGYASYFGRLNYDYNNKYFLNASYRYDGLSRFAEANRFGHFPGISVGWRVSEENFWKNNLPFINEFKLRGSWARTGNDRIVGGLFPYLSTYGSAAYGATPGIVSAQVGNPGLQWETTEKLDFGLDAGFFDNRLTFTFDYFENSNNGLVFGVPVPVSFGVPGNTIFQNIGDMESKGFEISIAGDVVRTDNIKLNVGLNYTNLKNEVKTLYNNQDIKGAYNILSVGQPVNALFGYTYSGVNSGNGNPMYTKGDGTLIQGNIATSNYYTVIKPEDATLGTATTLSGTTDRTILGNVLPTYFGGLNVNLDVYGFTFEMLWRFSGGNKIYNQTRQDVLMTQAFQNNGKGILDRWQKAGDATDVPRLWAGRDNFTNLQGNATSRFVEDGSFVRLQNAQLSYGLNSSNLQKWTNNNIKSFRVFVQGQNLLLITDYSGIDPENITESGIDNNTVPQPRIISFGFNLGL